MVGVTGRSDRTVWVRERAIAVAVSELLASAIALQNSVESLIPLNCGMVHRIGNRNGNRAKSKGLPS
jgi:hypothetical protein